MSVVLDAGALIAVERADREMVAILKRELRAGRSPITHAAVVGQVWRGGAGRQASLARLLPAVDVTALDEELGREAGVLLGRARSNDVVDAALVCMARDGDEVFTSDPKDLHLLARTAGRHVDLVPI
jgi:hypothetical protein